MTAGTPESHVFPEPINIERMVQERPLDELTAEMAYHGDVFDAAVDLAKRGTPEQAKLQLAIDMPVHLSNRPEECPTRTSREVDQLFEGQWQMWQQACEATYGTAGEFQDALTEKRQVAIKLRARKPDAPDPPPDDADPADIDEDKKLHTFVFTTVYLPEGTDVTDQLLAGYKSTHEFLGQKEVQAEPYEKITPSKLVSGMRELLAEHPELAGRLQARLDEARHYAGADQAATKAATAADEADRRQRQAAAEATWAAAAEESGTLTHGGRRQLRRGFLKRLRHTRTMTPQGLAGREEVVLALQDPITGWKHQGKPNLATILKKEREALLARDSADALHYDVKATIAARRARHAAEDQEALPRKNRDVFGRLTQLHDAVLGPPLEPGEFEVPDSFIDAISERVAGVVWSGEPEHELYWREDLLNIHIQNIEKALVPYEDPNDKTHFTFERCCVALRALEAEAEKAARQVAFRHQQGRAFTVKRDINGVADWEGRWPVTFTPDRGIVMPTERASEPGVFDEVVVYSDGSVDARDGRGRRDAFGNRVVAREYELPEEGGEGVVLAIGNALPGARSRRQPEAPVEGTSAFNERERNANESHSAWWAQQEDPSIAAEARSDAAAYGEALEQTRLMYGAEVTRRERVLAELQANHDTPFDTIAEQREQVRLAREQVADISQDLSTIKYSELYLAVGGAAGQPHLQEDGSIVGVTTLYGQTGEWRIWPNGVAHLGGQRFDASGRAA